MKNKEITPKQIRLCIVVVSLLIFLFVYLNVCDKYSKKTEDVKQQTKEVQLQIAEREKIIEANKGLDELIEKLEGSIDQVISVYPSNITTPNNIMFLLQLQKATNMMVPSVSFSENAIFYTSLLPIRGSKEELTTDNELQTSGECVERKQQTTEDFNKTETADATAETTAVTSSTDATQGENETTVISTMTGISSTINMNFQVSYQGLKECLSFVENYPQRAGIDSISMNYDAPTGQLVGSMTLTRYAILGNGQPFTKEKLVNIPVGKDMIFDTVK